MLFDWKKEEEKKLLSLSYFKAAFMSGFPIKILKKMGTAHFFKNYILWLVWRQRGLKSISFILKYVFYSLEKSAVIFRNYILK